VWAKAVRVIRSRCVGLACALWIVAIGARFADAGSGRQRDADVTSLLVAGSYEQAEAVARAHVDALRIKYGNHSLEVADASDLLVRVLVLNGKGAAPSTREVADRTLRTREGHIGRTHADLASTLMNVGDVLVETGEHARAVRVLERAVSLRESSGAATVDLAEALDHLGSALLGIGRRDTAMRVLERSLRIKESALDGGDVRIARTLERIGLALQGNGDYDRARAPVRRAAEIQAAADQNHPAYVDTLNVLAWQVWFEGNLVEARDVAARAVALAERSLRPDHPQLARSLSLLAGAFYDLGDLTQARVLWARALAIAERSLGPDHHETGARLNDLAIVELQLGAYPAARALYERAHTIARKKFGAWHDQVATAVYNLASVDQRVGDYVSARRLFARAITVWEQALGRDHPFVAVGLIGLATNFRQQGLSRQAIPLVERALAIRERSLGPRHRQVARTLVDVASVLDEAGETGRAFGVVRRALEIWEAIDASYDPERAIAYSTFARLQVSRGDFADARRYYERALTIRQRIFGESHPLVAEAQIDLARPLLHLGDREAALRAALQAERSSREHLGLMIRYLPERQSLTYASRRPAGLSLMLSLMQADSAATTLDALVRARSMIFDEMGLRTHRATDAIHPELGPLWDTLNSARQRLANIIVRSPTEQEPKQYRELIEAARVEKERAERSLAERSSEFREELESEIVGFEQIRNAVPDRSAIVSIVRYDRTVASRLRTVPHYAAFVLVHGSSQPKVVDLGAASVIERGVARWRTEAGIGLVRGASASVAEAAYRLAGAALRRLAWDPVTPHLVDVDRVFVVPDGAYNVVNLGALPVGTSEFLVERGPTIHYLPTERDLASVPRMRPSAKGLFALGGPSFDSLMGASRRSQSTLRGTPCATLQSMQFGELPGTRQEVTEIAGLWKSAGSSAGGGDVHLSVAGEATERAFKQEAPGRRVLHLATHGFFLGGDCEPSSPGTRAVGRVTPARPKSAPRIDLQNPLLVSGLAFAGANQRARAKPDQDDGILTAEEISGMNLQGTEWAVLSACDTGLGEVKAGEGVFGLRRAFQIAGVRTVIMSLWSVEDEATRQWMRALYEARLNDRLDTAESVRAASLRVLRDRRAKKLSTHPFYWGAFVAAGAWQ
jgi:CHAT domain-containing protein/tetratricopeptide (TPR) repeat protein